MNLTKPQQLIYNMERFSGGSIATICGSMLMNGSASTERIKAAINKMIECNDALRIRISEKDGVPFQLVETYQEREIEVLPFSTKKEFLQYAEKLAKEPMNLYGELFQAYAVIVGTQYGLLVKIHHMISDAWTLSLIGSQFAALMKGELISPSSYLEYIESENAYLVSTRFQNDRAFWLETFSKCDEPTCLSDVLTQNVTTRRSTFVLNEEKTKMIAEYASKTGASVFSVLMTAVAVYFNRVKNNLEKFYIGTAVLNRGGREKTQWVCLSIQFRF